MNTFVRNDLAAPRPHGYQVMQSINAGFAISSTKIFVSEAGDDKKICVGPCLSSWSQSFISGHQNSRNNDRFAYSCFMEPAAVRCESSRMGLWFPKKKKEKKWRTKGRTEEMNKERKEPWSIFSDYIGSCRTGAIPGSRKLEAQSMSTTTSNMVSIAITGAGVRARGRPDRYGVRFCSRHRFSCFPWFSGEQQLRRKRTVLLVTPLRSWCRCCLLLRLTWLERLLMEDKGNVDVRWITGL